ncbi:MAG: Rha family transcriptional regulator [Desulfobulbus sp.]|nr:Rha family transcriptional regulator [Desulfobulbus sp.]
MHDLFPETLLVSRQGERIFTTSLKVAEHFHKRHSHVLKAIEKLIFDLGDPAFSEPNFRLSKYAYQSGRNTAKEVPMWELTEEGFALLAMGFTGKEALRWKVDFLQAFRAMERQLAAVKEREANALYRLKPRWKPIAEHPEFSRSQLISLTGHASVGSITACRARMRGVGLI